MKPPALPALRQNAVEEQGPTQCGREFGVNEAEDESSKHSTFHFLSSKALFLSFSLCLGWLVCVPSQTLACTGFMAGGTA